MGRFACESSRRISGFGFECLAQTFRLKQAFVHAMQAFRHRWGNQRIVLYFEQMVDDEPHRFVGGHPVLAIESFQVYRHRKPPKRTLSPQIEVDVEIAQRQFTQGAVDRFAPAASGEVRFGDRTPTSVLAKDGDHMVGVVLRFKVEQQRRESVGAQRGRGEDGTLETVRSLLG